MPETASKSFNDHSQKDIRYHAKTAHLYDAVVSSPREAANQLLFRSLDQVVTCGDAMLDLGCGTGQMLLRYGTRFESAIGVDHSSSMLRYARLRLDRARIRNVTLIESDILSYTKESKDRFDLITSVGCLHHLTQTQIDVLFGCIGRLLRRNGCFLIAEPVIVDANAIPALIRAWNARSVMPERAKLLESADVEEPDEGPLPEEMLYELAKKNGFMLMRESRGWEMFPRRLPPSFMDRALLGYFHWRYGKSGNILALMWQRSD